MSGNRIGGLKTAKTNKERHGEDYYVRIGAKGGSTPTTKLKGFAANRQIASEAGRKGGSISRRRANV